MFAVQSLVSRLTSRSSPAHFIVRWNSKPNVKHPMPPHFEKALVLAATEKIFPPSTNTPQTSCHWVRYNKRTAREPHPYEILIAKLIRSKFESNSLIGIFQLNQMFHDDLFQTKVLLYRAGIEYASYPNDLIALGLHDTKFAPVLKMVGSLRYECFTFCDKSLAGKLVKLQKKLPNIVLLGGIVDDRLLSKSQLIEYSKMSLDMERAKTCSLLASFSQETSGQLDYHSSHLSQLLDGRAKQTEEKS